MEALFAIAFALIFGLAVFMVVGSIGAVIFEAAWNSVLPTLFGLPTVSWWQSFLMLLLVWLVGQTFNSSVTANTGD